MIFFPEARFELLLFWPQIETRKRLTQSIICKSLFVNLNIWPNWWNWLISTTWYSQWLLIVAGAHSIQPTIANSQNALPSLWNMTTTEMLPECRGPFEFLDLISTGGRQLWKCGNDTIFKPTLKNVTSLPVAICYSLSFTSWNHADFGFANRCCRALCVKGGKGNV